MGNHRWAATAAAVTIMVLVAGCAWPKTPPKPAGEPVKLEFWTAAPDDSPVGKTVHRLVDQFNQSQKDILVTASYQGSYADIEKKVTSAVQARTPPAVIQASDAVLASLVSRTDAADLDPLISAAQWSDFASGFLSPLTVGGHHYALPFARAVTVIYYNTRLVPEPPHTWAELQATAADVAESTDGGLAMRADVYAFAPFLYLSGGRWLKDGAPAFAGP